MAVTTRDRGIEGNDIALLKEDVGRALSRSNDILEFLKAHNLTINGEFRH